MSYKIVYLPGFFGAVLCLVPLNLSAAGIFQGQGKICTFVIGGFITGFFPQATSDCKSVFKF